MGIYIYQCIELRMTMKTKKNAQDDDDDKKDFLFKVIF